MDKDVRIKQLEEENAALRKRLAELEAKIASLTRNSSNSSKPPSSDITKPPKSGGSGGRKKSFKKRKRKSRRIDPAPFPEERVDQAYDYFFDAPGDLVALDEYRTMQQVELIDNPFRITEHRCRVYLDPVTGKKVVADLPPELRRGGLLGPKLTAWIGYLKSVSRCSYTQIGAMLEEVFDLPVSRGLLAKAVRKMGDATAPIYDQLCVRLPSEPVLNIDETGHKDRGKLMWTWCFRSPNLTAYRISPSRGSQVLTEMLGVLPARLRSGGEERSDARRTAERATGTLARLVRLACGPPRVGAFACSGSNCRRWGKALVARHKATLTLHQPSKAVGA